MKKFPQNFLWGAATSAYQVEGNNNNSDWWPWEKEANKEPSASACRHYELFEKDFELAKNLNHNAHRFSVEWSRIEPSEGQFSQPELKHYLDVLCALKARNIEPVVTLHHFTNPLWFSKAGGWENKKSITQFLAYAEFIVRALAPHVTYWVTINEPTIFISHAYIFGAWPPQLKSPWRAKKVQDNMARAHHNAYRLIHKIYNELGLGRPSVGFSQFTQAFVPCTQRLRDRVAAFLRNKWFNFGFINECLCHQTLDFIGLNYYSRQLVELKKWGIGNLFWDTCSRGHHPVKKNSLGWDIYPEGLYNLLLQLKKPGLPVIITENGICTSDDQERWDYIKTHLRSVLRAIEEGVNVRGYLHWSLMDNFEWDKGFSPRFGLISVDYATQQRTIRESARKFGEICKTGEVPNG